MLCQGFSSLAGIGGDESDGSTDVPAAELPEDESFEPVTTAYYDETSLMSVNDDLADYDALPIYNVWSSDLTPKYQYGNVISSLSGDSGVDFYFNGFVLNTVPLSQNVEFECVLTFANGYDKSVIYVDSSTSGITKLHGALFYPTGGNATNWVTPTGFQYVDDNTIRISYSAKKSSGVYLSSDYYPTYFSLEKSSYLKGNTVKCQIYVKRSNPVASVVAEGGGDGGGSGSGGSGSAT